MPKDLRYFGLIADRLQVRNCIIDSLMARLARVHAKIKMVDLPRWAGPVSGFG